ncbi:MAG: hypothetical protein WCD04_12230 [Terriglobia bacterium]
MFTRAVLINVKPGCEVELTRTFEQEVIPRFRKEKDFRGLLAFTVPDGTEALSLSLWDPKETVGGIWARCFGALMALARVVLGIPSVQIYEVSNSAFHTMEQTIDQGEVVEATPDLEIYQSALRPFKLSPTRQTLGRVFPLVWCLINSFHL